MTALTQEPANFALRHPRAAEPALQMRFLLRLRLAGLTLACLVLALIPLDMMFGLLDPVNPARSFADMPLVTWLCALFAIVATGLKGPLRPPGRLGLALWAGVAGLAFAGPFLPVQTPTPMVEFAPVRLGDTAALGLVLLATGQLLRRRAVALAVALTTAALFPPLVTINAMMLGQQGNFNEISLLMSVVIVSLAAANAIGFARRPVMRLIAAETRSARLVRVNLLLWAGAAILMPLLLRAIEVGSNGSFALVYSAQMFGVLITILYFGLRFSNMLDTARRAERRLLRDVGTDHLTGAATRRAGLAYFTENGWRHSIGVILIDLDHFKAINDAYGHGMGDDVLKFTSSALRQVVRANDLVVRWGGEEFLVLCRVETKAELKLVSEQIRAHLQNWSQRDDSLPDVTASFGAVLALPDLEPDLEKWLHKADQALYSAKAKGRNRVVFASGGEFPTLSQLA